MQNYFSIAAPQITNDLDFSPIQNALSNYQANQRLAKQDALAAENTQYARSRDALQDKIAADQRDYQRKTDVRNYQDQKRKEFGNTAITIANIKDPSQKKIAHDAMIKDYVSIFGQDGLEPEDLDPNTGPLRMIAHSGVSYDPVARDLQNRKALSDIGKNESDIAKTQQEIATAANQVALAKRLLPGSREASPDGAVTANNFATGQPTATNIVANQNAETPPQSTRRVRSDNPVDNMTEDEANRAAYALSKGDQKSYTEIVDSVNQRVKTSRGVENILKNLGGLANRFSSEAFQYGLGPYQGPEGDRNSYVKPLITSANRLGGEVMNNVENFFSKKKVDPTTGKQTLPNNYDLETGKKANLVELRSEIEKGTGMLLSVIKPLIRLKGDQWTDTDTNNLNRALGNLLTSNDKPEYERRLKSTLDVIKNGLQIDIDPNILSGKSPKHTSTHTLQNEVAKINLDNLHQ